MNEENKITTEINIEPAPMKKKMKPGRKPKEQQVKNEPKPIEITFPDDTEVDEKPLHKEPFWMKERDRKREKVKGIFHNHECPGGATAFNFREFKGDPIEKYEFVDGGTYTIPLGVAIHLNKNCWYPEYEFKKGLSGIRGGYGTDSDSYMQISRKVKRFSFESLEFRDIGETYTQQPVIVEKI
jgi:hypothetical protein